MSVSQFVVVAAAAVAVAVVVVAVAAAAAGAVFAVVVLVDVCRSFSSTVRLTVDILILFEQSSRK